MNPSKRIGEMTMKKRGMFWFFLLAMAMLTGAALAEASDPVVFCRGSTVVDAGDMVSIRGEYLDQDWTAGHPRQHEN